MEKDVKIYYLPRYRSIVIGIILMLMGLALTFGMADYNRSAWAIMQSFLISFNGIGDFFISVLMLLFKAGFLVGGYFYLKYSAGVQRARLDEKGFYYAEIPKGNKYDKMAIDLGTMSYTPYAQIVNISLEKSFWSGWQIHLTTNVGTNQLTALGVLSFDDKKQIVELVKQRKTAKVSMLNK